MLALLIGCKLVSEHGEGTESSVLILFLWICREPFVSEEELKLMLRGAELSGAIEEEEQV